MLVSVVIPVLGPRQLLQRCLHALRRQSFDPRKFEIIVVDVEPSSATQRVVLDIAALTQGGGPAIHYIGYRGPGGPAAARNCGWRIASGELIAFTEPDTQAHSDWLRLGFNSLYQRAEAAWGRIVKPAVDVTKTRAERGAGVDTDNASGGSVAACAATRFAAGNCFCTRELLQALDGFDERFNTDWHADTDLFFRMLGRGVLVLHVQNAWVERVPRVASWRASLSQNRQIVFDALLHEKHPMLYQRLICTTPCSWYYPIVLALMLTCSALLIDAPLLAAMTGFAWLVLTLILCGQRLAHNSWRIIDLPGVILSSMLSPPLALFWRAVAAMQFRVRLF
ncbi:glycosyltransferase [Actimicrobium antarcticum]|uniref:Glycosyltransferase n=2 Tax=Actimicrobium antarcticum TaxID=1051899 RepID=A0ABP7U044_9BURK